MRGQTGCFRIERWLPCLRIEPCAPEGAEEFHKVATEAFVLASLPDKTLFDPPFGSQILGDLYELLGGLRRLWHQVLSPVEQTHIGTERPAIQGTINAVAQLGTGHQRFDVVAVKPGIQGLQPVSGHIFRQPGDVDQQCIKGRRPQKKTADGQIRDGFGVPWPSDDVQGDPAVVFGVESLHLIGCCVDKGRRHQDRDLLWAMHAAPADGACQQQTHQHQQQATHQRHQPTLMGARKPASCSSAQSRTV